VKGSELALRKELALTRLRIARTELALARAQRKPDALATTSSAIDLASSLVEQTRGTRWGGSWASYVRILLRVASVVMRLRRV
jgi:hypothetical protein